MHNSLGSLPETHAHGRLPLNGIGSGSVLACLFLTKFWGLEMLTFFRPKTYAASPNGLLYRIGLVPPNNSLTLSLSCQRMHSSRASMKPLIDYPDQSRP